jgi:hypothetical protein
VSVRVELEPTTKACLAGEELLRRGLDVRNETFVNLVVLT